MRSLIIKITNVFGWIDQISQYEGLKIPPNKKDTHLVYKNKFAFCKISVLQSRLIWKTFCQF